MASEGANEFGAIPTRAGFYAGTSESVASELLAAGLPEGLRTSGHVPFDGWEEILAALGPLEPGTIVDLGCGIGCPGLWLSESLGARLIGIDQSRDAVAQAVVFAANRCPKTDARFESGDACETGLPSGLADAVVSLDVLQLVTDRPAFLAEAHRLLRDGGCLALTTWEGDDASPERFPRDLAAELRAASFVDVDIADRPAWTDRQRGIYRKVLEIQPDHPDDAALERLAVEARAVLENAGSQRRRIRAFARKEVRAPERRP